MECDIKFYGVVLVAVLLLAGCASGAEDASWYETKEEAIQAGLEEQGEGAVLLGTEEYKGETIAFLQRSGAFGIANIVEKENRFQFIRKGSMYGFDVSGDLPYSKMGTNHETASGVEVSLLIGKVFDPTINTLLLKGDGATREIGPKKDSTLFYAIHEAPFSSLEVVRGE